MHMDKSGELITLATAARLMGVSYQGARDLLLRGRLDGGRDNRGHWWIRARSVRRYVRQRLAARMQTVAR